MKITFVCDRYWPAIGGCENAAHFLATELSLTEDVNVITAINDDRAPSPANISVFAPTLSAYSDGKIKVIPLNPTVFERILLMPALVYYIPKLRRYFYHQLLHIGLYDYKSIIKWKLIRYARGSSIIHAYGSSHLSWAAYEAARFLRIPFVVTPLIHPGQYGTGPLDIDLYRNADAIIAGTDVEKKYYLSEGVGDAKIHVIGLADRMDTTIGKDLICSGLKKTDRLVLYIGRIEEYKGVDKLIEVARLMPEIKFAFVGPLVDRVSFSKKPSNAIYSDPLSISSEMLAAWYHRADIVCLISKYESFGLVIMEAWQFKKPVIVSDTPSLRCIVDDGINGVVVYPEVAEIKRGIEKILNDTGFAARLGEAGYRTWQENYTPEKIKTKVLHIYRNCSPGHMKESENHGSK